MRRVVEQRPPPDDRFYKSSQKTPSINAEFASDRSYYFQAPKPFFLYCGTRFLLCAARSHHCFNIGISFVEQGRDNLKTEHSSRTNNKNGRFC
ncbi:MAG: hypothetical protein SAK29_39110, partial [Scytonema sp. PMC 1069.18]|nr:hypothetical protein [Scytonema sp. PMC 1069.18]